MLSDWNITSIEKAGHIHLKSKDGFWSMEIHLLYTTHSPHGDLHTYRMKISQPDSKFEILGPTFPESSESSAIMDATLWAAEKVPKLERAIFLSDKKIARSARANLRHAIVRDPSESSHALLFVKEFIKKLNKDIKYGSDRESARAYDDLMAAITNESVFRMALPEDLAVESDWLEGIGALRSKNPESSKAALTDLVSRCQHLWDLYCKKPTKKNLQAVFAHLELMKSSKSDKVKKERARCLRAANKEAKRLKM